METNPNYYTVEIGDTKYFTTLTKNFENRKKWVKPNPKQIISFIPGTVLELFVKEGQKVNEGDVLLILEAMKMKNRILSPLTGTIKDLNILKGKSIPKGVVMIEFV